jgi:hypothetical protein
MGGDANPERRIVTQEMLEREIVKVRKAKAEHSGESGKNRRMIEFCDHVLFTIIPA